MTKLPRSSSCCAGNAKKQNNYANQKGHHTDTLILFQTVIDFFVFVLVNVFLFSVIEDIFFVIL